MKKEKGVTYITAWEEEELSTRLLNCLRLLHLHDLLTDYQFHKLAQKLLKQTTGGK